MSYPIPEAGSMSAPQVDNEHLFGRNVVRAALKAGRPLRRVLISRESSGEVIREIVSIARSAGLPVDFRTRANLDRLVGRNHQGVVAMVAAHAYADFASLLVNAGRRAFFVFLDRIQDPHNLGAIIRSACVTGADAVVIPKRQSVGLTGSVAKAAAGAVDHIPVCCVSNLRQAIDAARESGIWMTGLSPDASQPFTEIDFRGPMGIVIGGENGGIRRNVLAACDNKVGLSMARHAIGSFNASVAAGIVLFEVHRQRSGPGS